jgi:hypothetical protein
VQPPPESHSPDVVLAVAREASAKTIAAGLELECQLYREKIEVGCAVHLKVAQ